MTENWTHAERLAAEVLASGSDDALRELLVELEEGPPSPSRFQNSSTGRRRSGKSRGPLSAARTLVDARGSGFLHVAVDSAVVLVALASIAIGSRPLAAPIVDARPVISEALEAVSLPVAGDVARSTDTRAITAEDRPVTAAEPISGMARDLEAEIGQFDAVAAMYAQKKLPCSQMRQSYLDVEDGWTRYSIARGRAYGGQLPDHLIRWDAALYEAVRGVDRDFTSSGCSRP